MIRFAIVGGGVSGCFLAHLLKSHKNISVTLFEKSRGLGGRCSVKRHEEYGSFNMGAPFFTNKNPELSSFFSFLINKSFISTLDHPIGYYHFNGSFREAHKKERFVGKPEMNSFLKKWADESTLVLKTEIKNIDFKKSKWVLEDQDKRRYPEFDVCVLALPSEQGKFLWRTHSELNFPQSKMLPCWTLMLVTKDIQCEYSSAFLNCHSLSWYSSSLLNNGYRKWVVHASSEWSQKKINTDKNLVKKILLQDLNDLIKKSLQVEYSEIHRWRYALCNDTTKNFSIWDQGKSLGGIGDWFCGNRVEEAMSSALHLFNRIERKYL